MYLLKLALRPWRLAPFSQLFSAIAVGFLLFLISFLFWLQHGLKPVLNRLQGEQVITAYVDHSLEKKDEENLMGQFREKLDLNENIELKFVDSDQFVSLLKPHYPDLSRELEVLGPDLQQVVPRYISVSGILPSTTLEKVKAISGVESAESSSDRYASIVGAFRALRWVSKILIGGLGLALLSGLIHLSRMNAYLHRDALTLLRFWGARSFTLAVPGMVSGVIVGLLGGAIASGGWLTLGHDLIHHIRGLSVILKGMPAVYRGFPLMLFFLGGVMGCISGILGSLSASFIASDRSAEI